MAWYHDLGYKANPLLIKPTENNNLIGYEKIIERLIYQIKIGNVIFLEGSYGSGKSSILKYVRKTFSNNILYFNCSSKFKLRKAIMEKRSIFRKLLFLKPKQMILLLDEVDQANPKDFDFLYEFYIMDRIKSIIFAATDFKRVPFNKAFKSDTKTYKLNELKNNLAWEILKTRLPSQTAISSQLAKKIFDLSERNPRRYLENLEDLMALISSMGKKKVTKKEVDSLLGKNKRIYLV
jgi:replication-associated recombination protein RarA